MRYGLIDLGSNTIRLVVYDISDGTFTQVINEKSFAGIISYIEHRKLLGEGVEKIIKTLKELLRLCQMFKCEDVGCFATASLRNLKNIESVLAEVKKRAGIQIRVISSEEEAYYDYLGLTTYTQEKELLCCDIGGGSAQIAYVKDAKIQEYASLEIGSLKMYKAHVAGFLPTDTEIQEIQHHVLNELKEHAFIANTGLKKMYFIGGTTRATARLDRYLRQTPDVDINGYSIKRTDIMKIVEKIRHSGYEGTRILNTVVAERAHTIIPGIIVIDQIVQYAGVDKFITIRNGVREGYLIANALKKEVG